MLGLPKELALSAALLLRLKTLLVSALGGIFYLQEGTLDKKGVSENESTGTHG
jgi:hypothetical protein